MHNGKMRKISIKRTKAKDGTKGKFWDSFIDFMKLEDDDPNRSYKNDKNEKVGRILLMISLIISITLSVVPIILAIVYNLVSNKLAF